MLPTARSDVTPLDPDRKPPAQVAVGDRQVVEGWLGRQLAKRSGLAASPASSTIARETRSSEARHSANDCRRPSMISASRVLFCRVVPIPDAAWRGRRTSVKA